MWDISDRLTQLQSSYFGVSEHMDNNQRKIPVSFSILREAIMFLGSEFSFLQVDVKSFLHYRVKTLIWRV